MKSGIMRPIIVKLRRHRLGCALLYLLAAAGALIFVTFVLDALLIIPASGRIIIRYALPIILGAAAIVMGISALRVNPLHCALWLEKRDPRLGSKLSNAVQFGDPAQGFKAPGDTAQLPFLGVLRERAIALGNRAAAGIDMRPVVRHKKVIALRSFLAVLLALAAIGWLAQDVVKGVLPRFIDPAGDHPPYSRLKFEVAPGDISVLFGEDFEVRTRTRGRPVPRLFLVTTSRSGMQRTKLFRSPDRSYFQTLSNIREDTLYYVTDGRARSPKYKINVRYTPQIATVRAHLTFPEHTGLQPMPLDMMETDSNLRVPRGTRIKIETVSNRPLAQGRLWLTPSDGSPAREIPLEASGSAHTVDGRLTADSEAGFRIEVTDTDGLKSADDFSGRILLKADQPPRITVVQPGRHAVAVPDSIIPVRVEAGDDYGIRRIIWFRGMNQSVEQPRELPVQSLAGSQAAQAEAMLNLGDLGVRPGDVIEYFFEAMDNNPHRPNLATSRPFRLEIISLDTYRDILKRRLAQQTVFKTYESLGNYLRRLSEQAADIAARSAADQVVEKELQELMLQIADYRQALRGVLAAPVQFDIEKSLHRELAGQLPVLDEILAHETDPGATAGKKPAAGAIAERLKRMATREAETIAEPIRHIKAVAAILARADRFTQLYQRQLELNRIARRFAERPDHGFNRTQRLELQEIAVRQRRVRDALDELLGELRLLIRKIPEDSQYANLRQTLDRFLMETNGFDIVHDLETAADGFATLLAAEGISAARRAAANMAELIQMCQTARDQGRQCLSFVPSLTRGFGNTLDQVVAAMNGDGGMGSSANGYSLIAEQALVFGPRDEVIPATAAAGGPVAGSGGRQASVMSAGAGRMSENSVGASHNAQSPEDLWVPPRYRRLADAYFRKIAENQPESRRSK